MGKKIRAWFKGNCRGQAAVEYTALIAMFITVALVLVLLLGAFNSYGWRIINLVGLNYP